MIVVRARAVLRPDHSETTCPAESLWHCSTQPVTVMLRVNDTPVRTNMTVVVPLYVPEATIKVTKLSAHRAYWL